MKNNISGLLLLGTLTLTIIGFLFWQNNHIVSRALEIRHQEIPESFQGYTIVHLADLHNKSFGKEQAPLIRAITSAEPDLLVITGDLMDSRRPDPEPVRALLEGLPGDLSVVFVTGNHEQALRNQGDLLNLLSDHGVILLDNRDLTLEQDGKTITLCGIQDPGTIRLPASMGVREDLPEGYRIALVHRPEFFDTPAADSYHLLLSGHAHGGQIRLPFLGGLAAPGQGFFPAYTSGLYHRDDTSLMVSRGLGNSLFPFRIFNRPDLPVLKLFPEK